MKPPSITSLPPSPEADRHSRMMKYSLAMGIRVLCIVAALFTPGWWLLLPAAGAIFLPYFAVVIANNSWFAGGDRPETPSGVVVRDPNLSGSGTTRQPTPEPDESAAGPATGSAAGFPAGSDSGSNDNEPESEAS